MHWPSYCLTICVLESPEGILWHTVKIQIKFCSISSGSALFTKIYSKTCVKPPRKNRQKKILMTNGSLMKVESIAHSAILLTCIK